MAAAATPSLLKPILFINPLSLGNLNIRGFGLPGCATGVRVPTSIKPNPKWLNSLNSFASLSKPAAKPTGLGKSIPNTFRCKAGF